ncbi:Hypothetical protein CINCED_3A017743 [Cinara cedri]|uniref:Uncharacterized protein n=1 Tax=Cinara cedri TaxID=506608 RepID=A0A5E4NK25_9HEMI|nr:Hypothetical protein CINCED_3A017743 [Cinara cedri]
MDTSDDVNILKILFEEEDDDDVLLLYLSEEKRKGHDQLINGHLKNNEIKFREFFRINRNQFDFILNLIRDDLALNPTFFIRKPITSSSTLLNLVIGALIVERPDQRQPAVNHK